MASDQEQSGQKFIAIVLAGSRGPSDPVAEAAGVRAKALFNHIDDIVKIRWRSCVARRRRMLRLVASRWLAG